MKASDYIARFLEINGVKYAFGMSEVQYCTLLILLYNKTEIQVISGSNEQFSAFEADGYARSLNSEHPGICFATSGPGATNLITELLLLIMIRHP